MNKIFLDNNSTTPVDPDVLDSMIPYFTEKFGNPSSRTHAYGWEAEAAVDIAREEISNLINADEDEIIFTSGATESNNLIFLNILKYSHKNIITATTEHKAILDICDYINKNNQKINNTIQTQDNLFEKASSFRNNKSYYVNTKNQFIKKINDGGFVYAHWDGTAETENLIKKETKATIRCIPIDSKNETGECLFSGKPSEKRVLFAKNY